MGDVVELTDLDGKPVGVVFGFEDKKRIKGFLKDCRYFSAPIGTYKKTGKHIDLTNVLEQLEQIGE